MSCDPGLTRCGNNCVDLQTDIVAHVIMYALAIVEYVDASHHVILINIAMVCAFVMIYEIALV